MPTELSWQLSEQSRAQSLLRRSGPVFVALCFALAVWLGWRRWPFVPVDFGLQLYVPWQLAEGKVLHRDLAYLHGPLSQYLHAMVFALFGPGMLALALLNIIVAAAATLLLYRITQILSDRLTATVCAGAFVFVFSFAQLVVNSNYNFVTPYTYEITHGAVLSLACLYLLHRYQQSQRRWLLAISGALLGLVLLTKVEVAAAACAALGAVLAGQVWLQRRGPRRAVIDVIVFAVSAVVAVGICFLLLAWRAGPYWALQSVVLPWRYVLEGKASQLLFFKVRMGSIDVPAGLERMAWAALGVAALVAMSLAGLAVRRAVRWRRMWELLVFAAVVGVVFLAVELPLKGFAAALPLIMLIGLAVAAAKLTRAPSSTPRPPASPPADARLLGVGMFVFALGLMVKMMLNVHLRHYGFVLAMPATLMAIVLLGAWLPAWVSRRGGWGGLTRALVLAAAALVVGEVFVTTQGYRADRTHSIGEGADRIYVDRRAERYRNIIELIESRVGAGQTLAMMPEGVMFNYLTRRAGSARHVSLMPAEWTMFGGAAILESLEADPPDFVGLVHVDTSAYGLRYFGTDYGREVMLWLGANYRGDVLLGNEPLRDGPGGFALLRRIAFDPRVPSPSEREGGSRSEPGEGRAPQRQSLRR